ncbi:MAG: Kae1-associated serine/threonine protein kinase [Candidatus Bathyarchaeota archaeon]|jgi:TP53 regulating kinase-like protein|nr:MAG: Kae1-associated serine/threonine protein kinase [Candidatus Bathyarchaeota archaeon]
MLVKKGAEASLFLEDWQERQVIMKRRLPKKYRLLKVDERIRTYRTIHESQLLHSAKEAGVPTPTIFLINLTDSNIIMEYVQGTEVKRVLHNLPTESRYALNVHIGKLIGQLHKNRIVHGDLTTSNMILTTSGEVVLIDFGLGEKTSQVELRAVDLHLMKRAFQSTHFLYAKESFDAVMKGYFMVVGEETGKKVLDKVIEIEKRGRYISER